MFLLCLNIKSEKASYFAMSSVTPVKLNIKPSSSVRKSSSVSRRVEGNVVGGTKDSQSQNTGQALTQDDKSADSIIKCAGSNYLPPRGKLLDNQSVFSDKKEIRSDGLTTNSTESVSTATDGTKSQKELNLKSQSASFRTSGVNSGQFVGVKSSTLRSVSVTSSTCSAMTANSKEIHGHKDVVTKDGIDKKDLHSPVREARTTAMSASVKDAKTIPDKAVSVTKSEDDMQNNDPLKQKSVENSEKVKPLNMVANKEPKMSNIEREKLQLVTGMNDLGSQLRNVKLKATRSTVDIEKQLEFGEETPTASINDVSEVTRPLHAGSMMEELQKYLVKRFGPIVPVNLTETKSADLSSGSKDTERDKDIDDVTELLDNAIASGEGDEMGESQETAKDVPPPPKLPSPTASTGPTSPRDLLQVPIFFKTSIKKDPGSKLHDQLIKELGVVMRKRERKNNGEPENDNNNDDKENEDTGVKFPRKRISASGNKVLANKALLANLENQLQRTLHKNKIFQRQKLKVVDLETVEVGGGDGEELRVASPTGGIMDISAVDTEQHKTGAKLILDTSRLQRSESVNVKDSGAAKAVVSVDSSQTQSRSSQSSGRSNSGNISVDSDAGLSSDPTASCSQKRSSRDPDSEDRSLSEEQELYVYAFKNPSGRTEGVVCSVERRESTRDSLGRPRRYLTCINIVAEKDTITEGNAYIGCYFKGF